jgi:hypothetical protein
MGRTGTDVSQLTRECLIKSDWRVRVESTAPFLSPVAAHPDLAGLRSEVQGGRLARVDRHRVPIDIASRRNFIK